MRKRVRLGWSLGLASMLWLAGCDPQRIAELQPGISTEADVRDRFGVPAQVWNEPDGARTFEYPRQPAGNANYMITLEPDGRLRSVNQVLTPQNFARIQPGMDMGEVRRLLGRPAKSTPYALKNETHVDWRYLELPNTTMIFTVVHGPDHRVLRTQTQQDMDETHGGAR